METPFPTDGEESRKLMHNQVRVYLFVQVSYGTVMGPKDLKCGTIRPRNLPAGLMIPSLTLLSE